MKALLIISILIFGLALLSLAGFVISLIVGAITDSSKTRKIGIIGTSISSGIFAISIIGIMVGANSVGYDEVSRYNRELGERYSRDDRHYDHDEDYDDDFDVDDYEFYSLGRKVSFDSGEKIQVNSIKEFSDRLPGQEKDEIAVVAEVSVTAPSDRSMHIKTNKFKLFDNNDYWGDINIETYSDKTFSKEIDAGKTVKLKFYYTVKNKGNYTFAYDEAAWQ